MIETDINACLSESRFLYPKTYQPVEKGAYSRILSIGEPKRGKVGIALL